jgi:hypothetical protein
VGHIISIVKVWPLVLVICLVSARARGWFYKFDCVKLCLVNLRVHKVSVCVQLLRVSRSLHVLGVDELILSISSVRWIFVVKTRAHLCQSQSVHIGETTFKSHTFSYSRGHSIRILWLYIRHTPSSC